MTTESTNEPTAGHGSEAPVVAPGAIVSSGGASVLADEAEACGALLVHYSTDYVFDGSGGEDLVMFGQLNDEFTVDLADGTDGFISTVYSSCVGPRAIAVGNFDGLLETEAFGPELDAGLNFRGK